MPIPRTRYVRLRAPVRSKSTATVCLGATIGLPSDDRYGPIRRLLRKLPERFGPQHPMLEHHHVLHIATGRTTPPEPCAIIGLTLRMKQQASTFRTRHPFSPSRQTESGTPPNLKRNPAPPKRTLHGDSASVPLCELFPRGCIRLRLRRRLL